MTTQGHWAYDDAAVRAEALRQLQQERAEQERQATAARAEKRKRLAVDGVRDTFSRTLVVLRNRERLADLLTHAGLTDSKIETRVNPTATTTEVTTITVPRLATVECAGNVMVVAFDGNPGQTLSHWVGASEVLRSGLRATTIQISEPSGGRFRVQITV
ncbi:MAG: hypothetical protein WAV90_19355 [Gordonia amarae]